MLPEFYSGEASFLFLQGFAKKIPKYAISGCRQLVLK